MPSYTIYKIQCGDEIYIGSTRDFVQRRAMHKSQCSNETCKAYARRIYDIIRQSGGWNSKMMSPIEVYECLTSIEARIREQHWIREYNPTLNTRQAHQTPEEKHEYIRQYNIANRDALSEYRHQYYIDNREKKTKYYREYYAAKKAAAVAKDLEELTAQ